MGIVKRVCYSVKCNLCGALLEDYAGELIGITNERKDAIGLAKEYNWKQMNNNTWVCPECSAKGSENI